MTTSLGLDLGLRDGAFCAVTIDEQGLVTHIQVISYWHATKRSRTKQQKPTVTDQLLRFKEILLQPLELFSLTVPFGEIIRVGVDWNENEVFWGSRTPAVTKAFLVGYLYRVFVSKLYIPLILPPRTVRGVLDLDQTADKTRVWERFQSQLSPATREVFDLANEHVRDAVILAWIAGKTLTTPAVGDELESGTGGVDNDTSES
jgi:hypothetical protein